MTSHSWMINPVDRILNMDTTIKVLLLTFFSTFEFTMAHGRTPSLQLHHGLFVSSLS